MFLDRHELNGVVSECCDARQDVLAKLIKGADLAFFLRHADVCFIHAQAAVQHDGPFMLPDVGS